MKLYEFFGSISQDSSQKDETDPNAMTQEDEDQLSDAVFWDILDDDNLHKKYFMAIAKKIKTASDNDSEMHDFLIWKPMVNAGCIQYYHDHDLPGNPREIFNKNFRSNLCKRIADHYHKDIIDDVYDLGN
jgi:hypothetical protein